MDRRELAGFLRSRRERITPADVGLPAGPRRRTPGLRREEVAQLAFISTEYYTGSSRPVARTRRARYSPVWSGPCACRTPSGTTCTTSPAPGPPAGPSREVRQSILDFLQRLPHAAAIVLSATYEVIAWNDLATALLADFSALPRHERNLVRWAFLAPQSREQLLYSLADAEAFARAAARDLRATAARYPDNPEVAALVVNLCPEAQSSRGCGQPATFAPSSPCARPSTTR